MLNVKALRGRCRLTMGSLAVIAGLLLGIGGAVQTHAAFMACETDPVVSLSNGHTVTLVASIAASARQVGEIRYTLHVPRNVSVTNVTYDSFGYLERLSVVADRGANQYASQVAVNMNDDIVVPVSATMVVSGQGSGLATGLTGGVLALTL